MHTHTCAQWVVALEVLNNVNAAFRSAHAAAGAVSPTREEKEILDMFASVFTTIDAGMFSVCGGGSLLPRSGVLRGSSWG